MMKYLVSIIILIAFACTTKPKDKPTKFPTAADVKTALKDMLRSAQVYRAQIPAVRQKYNGLKSLEEEGLWKKQAAVDSMNMDKIEDIIAHYGYPGKALVGDSLKTIAASVILQNPKRQAPYVGLIWKAAKAGDIPKSDAAFLEDRVLMFSGKKQKYGTSMKFDTVSLDPNTKFAVTKLRVWPIERPEKVDSLRFTIGLYPLMRQCEIMNIDVSTIQGYKFNAAAPLIQSK